MSLRLSIIVPVMNEAESLVQLTDEIEAVCRDLEGGFEVIFIDDGSTDGTWDCIRQISGRGDHIRAIRFRRNFGKAAALTAGMQAAGGELIAMMDGDLQDDPNELPRMFELLDAGHDVVNGWKQRRLDPWHKVYPSKVFNAMIGRLTGLHLHDHNCGFKLFRREVAEEIRIYGELHRFIPVLAHARGFRVTEMPVHHRARQYGSSKYGVKRFLRGFLDLITVRFLTGYGQRPQHMLGALGLLFLAIGFLGVAYLTAIWIAMHGFGWLDSRPIGSRPLLLYSVAFTLLGAQALSLGLMAELIIANAGHERPNYSVADQINRS